jgi:hypothetical protein
LEGPGEDGTLGAGHALLTANLRNAAGIPSSWWDNLGHFSQWNIYAPTVRRNFRSDNSWVTNWRLAKFWLFLKLCAVQAMNLHICEFPCKLANKYNLIY